MQTNKTDKQTTQQNKQTTDRQTKQTDRQGCSGPKPTGSQLISRVHSATVNEDRLEHHYPGNNKHNKTTTKTRQAPIRRTRLQIARAPYAEGKLESAMPRIRHWTFSRRQDRPAYAGEPLLDRYLFSINGAKPQKDKRPNKPKP